MNELHENQKKILDYLLDNPDKGLIEDLIDHLGITKTAVKLHLLRLIDLGYVKFVDHKGAVGRPKRQYLLTESGHDAFPKKYSWLSNVILDQISSELKGEGIEHFMKRLADSVAQSMMGDIEKSSTPALRLKKITTILNELGYRASLQKTDPKKGAIIEATNCVYHSVAQKHPGLCQFDVRFLEKTSGLSVNLESCIARGGSVCRFCLKNK